MNRRVLIVGAGIAGQTMSCALAMNGVMPDLVEIKSDWDILGAGMYVQSNALRGFAEIGIADKITDAGWHSRAGAATITNAQGEILAKTTIPSNGNPALSGFSPISRPVLHEILQQATEAAGVEVQMGKTVSDLRLNADDVHVVFTDGTEADYDLVVGADGIHSKVRSLVFDSVEPEYSGFSNWRVILPKPQSLDTTIWQMGLEKSIGIIPISHDKLYIAGVSKEPGNPWFERENMLELMRARFADFGGLAGELMAQVRDPDQIVYTPINEIIKPLPWVKGQVALVGDAAHASTPFWAQGAAMAVEDVVLLAQLLKRSDPIKTILAEWQQRRYERCAFVQEGSKRTGVQGHVPGEEAMLKVHAYIRANAQSDLDARYSRLNQPI